MTLSSPVKSCNRLDQRHLEKGCRRLSVCSVVWPGCWLWRTEAHHDHLLTQWWGRSPEEEEEGEGEEEEEEEGE